MKCYRRLAPALLGNNGTGSDLAEPGSLRILWIGREFVLCTMPLTLRLFGRRQRRNHIRATRLKKKPRANQTRGSRFLFAAMIAQAPPKTTPDEKMINARSMGRLVHEVGRERKGTFVR